MCKMNIVMKEPLITFQTAKLAKEKGFKQPCHSYYFEDGEFKENKLTGTNGYYGEEYCFELEEFLENWNTEWLTKKNGDRCFGCRKSEGYFETLSAPTQSLLQKWLREKHKLHIRIAALGDDMYSFILEKLDDDGTTLCGGHLGEINYKTYEEALEVGLLESLKIISL